MTDMVNPDYPIRFPSSRQFSFSFPLQREEEKIKIPSLPKKGIVQKGAITSLSDILTNCEALKSTDISFEDFKKATGIDLQKAIGAKYLRERAKEQAEYEKECKEKSNTFYELCEDLFLQGSFGCNSARAKYINVAKLIDTMPNVKFLGLSSLLYAEDRFREVRATEFIGYVLEVSLKSEDRKIKGNLYLINKLARAPDYEYLRVWGGKSFIYRVNPYLDIDKASVLKGKCSHKTFQKKEAALAYLEKELGVK